MDYDPQIPNSGRDVVSSHDAWFSSTVLCPSAQKLMFPNNSEPSKIHQLALLRMETNVFWAWPLLNTPKPSTPGPTHWIWCRTYICSWYKDDPTKPNKLWVILGLLLDTHFFQALCFRSYGCRYGQSPAPWQCRGSCWRYLEDRPMADVGIQRRGKTRPEKLGFHQEFDCTNGGFMGRDSGNLTGCYWNHRNTWDIFHSKLLYFRYKLTTDRGNKKPNLWV